MISSILADPTTQGMVTMGIGAGITWCLKKLYDVDIRLTRLEQTCKDRGRQCGKVENE